jgi:chloramphenicol 3-O-phosphotransferase
MSSVRADPLEHEADRVADQVMRRPAFLHGDGEARDVLELHRPDLDLDTLHLTIECCAMVIANLMNLPNIQHAYRR